MPESPTKTLKWHHPSEVMKLHKLKQKKKALQARMKGDKQVQSTSKESSKFDNVFTARKRKNPFVKDDESTKNKVQAGPVLDESVDQTLFKLFSQSASFSSSSSSSLLSSFTSFSNVLNIKGDEGHVEVVKAQGKKWLPVDWALKSKVRLLSATSFQWNQKLKNSEEASGTTAFTRCLGPQSTETTLDTSPNAKFHQCCLYWQQPVLPWLPLFPRCNSRAANSSPSLALNSSMRHSFQQAWSDSLRSLFQLIRTGQCPYFYACANSFTVMFRAAGICGFGDVHAVITPTSRGFRQLLKQEDIEFTMPLKKKRDSDQGYETLDSVNDEIEKEDVADENWLKSFGVNEHDIKQINYTQDKIEHKAECDVDNSEQSLVLIEGVEVNSLYNFLINCKSATAITGPFAGIPPTLLAPVAFHGASLNSLKVRQNKVHTDNNEDYFSLELSGPILPTMIHNLFAISTMEQSLTASFSAVKSTEPFSKLKGRNLDNAKDVGGVVFRKENLSGCGLLPEVLQRFCEPDDDYVANVECLKYSNESKTYTWT